MAWKIHAIFLQVLPRLCHASLKSIFLSGLPIDSLMYYQQILFQSSGNIAHS